MAEALDVAERLAEAALGHVGTNLEELAKHSESVALNGSVDGQIVLVRRNFGPNEEHFVKSISGILIEARLAQSS